MSARSRSAQALLSTLISGAGSAAFIHRRTTGAHAEGTAGTFEQARADFELAWREYLPKYSEADFEEYRRQRARTAWKYAMRDAGCKLPTQRPSGVARCLCVASIDIKGTSPHIYAAHTADRPLADPDRAARKLVGLANAAEPDRNGRIAIELINLPFLRVGGSPAEYRAGIESAIADGWLIRHESGVYVKFTQAGADLLA